MDARLGHLPGRAVANLIAILDPSAVVLGGGLSNLDVLYERGRLRRRRALHLLNDELTTPIVKHRLGDSGRRDRRGAARPCLTGEHDEPGDQTPVVLRPVRRRDGYIG